MRVEVRLEEEKIEKRFMLFGATENDLRQEIKIEKIVTPIVVEEVRPVEEVRRFEVELGEVDTSGC